MRIALAVLSLLVTAGPVSADITTDLAGWWPFSGDAQDASGNGNHGTPNGSAVLVADRFGTPNSAFMFNGLDSRIDIPSSPSLESPSGSLTVAAWVRRDGWGMVGTQYNPILTKSLSTVNAFQYRLITTPFGVNTALNNWDTYQSFPFTFEIDTWYHVAATWDGDSLHTYVNGTLIGSGPLATAIVHDTRDLSIGSDLPGVLEIFYGDIDEVRIYARTLSDADISELAGVTTSVPLPGTATGSLTLGLAMPNPSRAATTIPLALPAPARISASVFDMAGRRVRVLLDDAWHGVGRHALTWDGRTAAGIRVPSGVYLVRVRSPWGSASVRILRLE
jgi:hypothetical protein